MGGRGRELVKGLVLRAAARGAGAAIGQQARRHCDSLGGAAAVAGAATAGVNGGVGLSLERLGLGAKGKGRTYDGEHCVW